MENNQPQSPVDEQQFQQAVNSAMGKQDQVLPPALTPIRVQLPDMERWLRDE